MRILTYSAAAASLGVILAPAAFASALSISAGPVSPGTTIPVATSVTFVVTPSGFAATGYTLADSATSTTASNANFDTYGNFSWTPQIKDIGIHTFTITGNNYSTNQSTSMTLTITVMPPPSVSISGVASNPTIAPGTKFTFVAVSSGFTNPHYIVGDSFGGTSITDDNIGGSSGTFTWTPDQSQAGQHMITVYVSDSSGHSASVGQTVQVGAGASLAIQSLSPGNGVGVGQMVSFTASPLNYSPTGYTVIDSFAGSSTVTSANINPTGYFSWQPKQSDIGTHAITVTGSVGSYGQSASTTQTIIVAYSASAAQAAATATTTTTTTTGSSGTALTSLQSQLAALQAQIAGLNAGGSATTTASASSASDGYVFKKFIGFGQHGKDVLELQKRLIALGFLSGDATGYFGKATLAAVKAFQAANGLGQKGYVGPGTRAVLNK